MSRLAAGQLDAIPAVTLRKECQDFGTALPIEDEDDDDEYEDENSREDSLNPAALLRLLIRDAGSWHRLCAVRCSKMTALYLRHLADFGS